jgi:hypothetical protein
MSKVSKNHYHKRNYILEGKTYAKTLSDEYINSLSNYIENTYLEIFVNDNIFSVIKDFVSNAIITHKENCDNCQNFDYCFDLDSLKSITYSEENDLQILERWLEE